MSVQELMKRWRQDADDRREAVASAPAPRWIDPWYARLNPDAASSADYIGGK